MGLLSREVDRLASREVDRPASREVDRLASREVDRPASAVRRNPRGAQYHHRMMILALQSVFIFVLVMAWFLYASIGRNSLISGTPGQASREYIRWFVEASRWSLTLQTLVMAFAGLAVAVVLGSAIAAISLSSEWMKAVTMPLVDVANAVPKLVLAPVFVAIAGIGTKAELLFVVTSLFMFPFFAITTTVRQVDPDQLRMLKVFGATRRDVLQHYYLPPVVASVLGNLRLVVPWSLAATVIFELLVVPSGIGIVIAQGQQGLQNSVVLGGIGFVATIAVVCEVLLRLLERRLVRWRG
jgi:NitT/TauT family transport system permease protein